MMQDRQPNLFTREDTLFGVCEGLAEDLGFNPLWLRLALTGFLFLNPVAAIGVYLAAGALVFASRWLFPKARAAAAVPAETAAPQPSALEQVVEPEPLAQAA
jgi:phage shock protein PspC (stress-responsive transcriptional regulator)